MSHLKTINEKEFNTLSKNVLVLESYQANR